MTELTCHEGSKTRRTPTGLLRSFFESSSLRGAVLLLILLPGLAQAQSRPAWWNDSWRWRALVQVSDGASSVWLTTGARARPDGADIWLIGPNGRAVPCALVHSAAGRHLLTFDAGQGGKGGLFAFYYGNPDATPAPRAPIPRGLFLKTRPLPPGADVNSWEAARKALSKPAYGAALWPQVYDAYNPFGPQENFISVYDGQIECPKAGAYRFATMSDDASFLLIDGRLVAEWPGRDHSINTGRRGEHGGEAQLSAGRHRFEYVAFSFAAGRRCAASWMPPGATRWEIIPAGAFAGVREVAPALVEDARQPVCAAFRAEAHRYLESGSARMVAVRFSQESSARAGRVEGCQWDFGDGQTSAEADPVHVYLSPGRYDVKLTARSAAGASDTFALSVEAKPIYSDMDFSAARRDEFAAWLREADVAKLTTEHLLALRDFLLEVAQPVKDFEVCRELDKRRKDLSEAVACDVSLALARHYREAPGQWRAAERNFKLFLDRCPANHPQRSDASLELGDLYFYYAGDYEKARGWFDKLRETLPRPDQKRLALIRLGDIERYQRKYDEARVLYLAAESDPAFRSKTPRDVAEGSLRHEAEAALAQNDGAAALSAVERWVWTWPTRRLDGQPMILRLRANLLLKNYVEVLKQAEIYIGFGADPDWLPYAHLYAGIACRELRRADAARAHLQTVIESWPESPAAASAAGSLKSVPR